MSYDLFAHNYTINLDAECFPYSCSAIDKFYEQEGSGSWTNFLGTSGAVPFPSTINDYTLSPGAYGSLGWATIDFPVGQEAHVDSCDEDQSGQYFREGNSTSPVITRTTRTVNDDAIRFIVGPYGQALTQTNQANDMRTAFTWNWYARKVDGGVLEGAGRWQIESVDTNASGTYDTLRVTFLYPFAAYYDATTSTQHIDNILTLAEIVALQEVGTSVSLLSGEAKEVFDFAYDDIFPDPDYLWVPMELSVELEDTFRTDQFFDGPFTDRFYQGVTATVTCKVGDQSVATATRGDLVINTQTVVSAPVSQLDLWKYDPVSTYSENRHFYADDIVSHAIAIGGIGTVDGDFTQFRLAFERNRASYDVPLTCIYQ